MTETAGNGTGLPAPLVSVVVPVYNADQHLEECLGSLFAQTLAPIEIIAVDDGSTDRSAAILARAKALGALRVITNSQNQGVSAARNAGLTAARGAYVAFVDADDIVFTTMYEDLYGAASGVDADVVLCGIRMVGADGTVRTVEPPPLMPGMVFDHLAVREALHSGWAARLLWYPVRSLYRRSMLSAGEVSFDTGIRKGEDSLFNLHALDLSERVIALDKALYDYRKHASSATARPLKSESENLERLGLAVTGFYTSRGFDERAVEDFYRHVLRSDLPTAIVRLRGRASPQEDIRALITTDIVRQAFRSQPISRLGVPGQVRAVLLLCRYRQAKLLDALLRVSGFLRRIRDE